MRTISRISLLLIALASVAACDGGGGEPIARPDQLRLSIVRGASQTGPVRGAGPSLARGVAADVAPDEVLPEPVVVRISAVGGASRGMGATGPSYLTIPAGAIVNWRIVGHAGCGAPFAAVTAADGADSVVNYWRRGTVAGVECRMVAEGIVGGAAFGSDTAVAVFSAGAPSRTYDTGISPNLPWPAVIGATGVQDAHGNAVPFVVAADTLPFTVGGAEAGTEAARTVTFTGTQLPQQQRFVLRLLDGAGIQIGKLLIVVRGDGLQFWRATGVDVPLD